MGHPAFDGESIHEGPVLVLVADGRVRDLDFTGALAPDRLEVVDLAASTLLPGLIDAHTHLTWEPASHHELLATESQATLLARARRHAAQALQAGITTVRDLGDRGYATVRLREAYRCGAQTGPELLSGAPVVAISTRGQRNVQQLNNLGLPVADPFVDNGLETLLHAVLDAIGPTNAIRGTR